MKQIKIVLFDLGNVIAHIDFNAFWNSLGFLSPEAVAPWKTEYELWTQQYETGFIPSAPYFDELAKVFRYRLTIEQLEQAFASIIQDPVEGMLECIKQISSACQTALVSNTNEAHYSLSLQRFEALHVLQRHYLSFRLGVMKPDPRFFKAILDDMQTAPSEMLFIDDLEVNVKGARKAGMHAVRFEGVQQLQESLKFIL